MRAAKGAFVASEASDKNLDTEGGLLSELAEHIIYFERPSTKNYTFLRKERLQHTPHLPF